jgi:hypothetical protein
MSEFTIGERVRIRDYNDIPEEHRTQGVSKMCGEIGTIEDVFYSEGKKCNLYVIQFDNFTKSLKMWRAELLEKVDESVSYEYEFEYLDNVVVARLYEVTEDSKTEIGLGHGHIFHEGAVGIAQAASYALKRLYYKLAGMED